MPNTFISASIATGLTIEAGHVTQSADAFTGTEAYDIIISGSLTTTGTNIMSSSASPSITSILTENDNHPFITGVTSSGPNFRMNLADADTSGSAYIALGRQTGNFGGTGFTAHYATGSNASQGEIVMSIGKNGQLGQIQDRFIVQSEPGPIGSNTFSELSLFAGTHVNNLRVVQGVVQNGTGDFANFSAGNQDIATGFKKHVFLQYSFNNTSSFAGFASSSLNTGSTARNFNANSIPFGIEAGVSDSDTAFFIDRGGTFGASTFVTASFEISKGGSINMEGHITSSGHGLFQAGKPIKTHTSNFTASLDQAGFYNIVHGNNAIHVTLSAAPIGAEYEFFQSSSVGNFTFSSGSGITMLSKNTSIRLAQLGSSAVLKKVGTSTYHLMGDLT